MKIRAKFLSFSLLLLVMLSLAVIMHRVEAYRKQSTLIVLQSSERVLQDRVEALAATPYSEDLYSFRPDTVSVAVYDKAHKRSKDIISERVPGAIAAGPDGRVYLADTASNGIRVINQSGQLVEEFPAPQPVSLAGLSSGNIVVASGIGAKLLRIYKPDRMEASVKFGDVKQFDSINSAQNHFLNRGKVVVGPSDIIYFVPRHAPTPSIRKYSSTGQLLSEFVVEGAAIDYQLQVARQFLSEKSSDCVGGFHIITSAAVDPVTGHLWVGMNGTSQSGVVYEYNADGEKLREFAFLISSPSGPREIITGVRDIVIKNPWIYILTWGGEVYRFNFGAQGTRISEVQRNEDDRKSRLGRGMAYLTSFTRMFSASATSTAVATLPQLPCPQAQPDTCSVTCNPGAPQPNRDCKEQIRKANGDIVIANTCVVPGSGPQPSCTQTVTLCNVTSGVRVTETFSVTCNAPDPGGGGGGDDGGGGGCTTEQDCPYGYGCHTSTGQCYNPSPIIIDADGDGFDLTDAANGVMFDMNGDGVKEKISWTSANSDDAFLFLDRNANGVVDNGKELFGNYTPQSQPFSLNSNGFDALAEFDKPANGGNNDGLIDVRDAVFPLLRLWQDRNHNGSSEPNELYTLPALGVRSIELDYKISKRKDQYGNAFRYRAKVHDNRGADVGRWAWDVFFRFHRP